MSFTDFAGDPDAESDATPQPLYGGRSSLPGYPVAGHPEWRAGVPGAGNLLGMVKFASSDPLTTKIADGIQPGRSGASDYETQSWRWNDPDALAYDLDRKQRQLNQAKGIANSAEAAGGVGTIFPPSRAVGAGVAGVGAYFGHVEGPRLEAEIQALKDRLDQLRSRSPT